MTRDEVFQKVHEGSAIDCMWEDWRGNVRSYLNDAAAHYTDIGDGIRMWIALAEIERLDRKFSDRSQFPDLNGYGGAFD